MRSEIKDVRVEVQDLRIGDLCTEDDFAFRQGKNARNEGVYAYK